MKATETPIEVYRQGPLTHDIDELVALMQRTRGMGARQARRFVGRRLTEATLTNYRLGRLRGHGQFPIGFRQASKRGYYPPDRPGGGQLLAASSGA